MLSISYSKNIAIGVSPDILDLGTLERGKEELGKFYVITPSDDTILVKLEVNKASSSIFEKEKYLNFVHNYSEQNSLGWIKLLNNPVELKKVEDAPTLFGGKSKGYRSINFILNIPEDAEPGYHVISILPVPIIKEETTGAIGAQMVAVAPIRIIFNIPGSAIRSGKILEISSGNESEDSYEISTYFLNTGTVTMAARASEITLRNNEGEIVKKLWSSIEDVRPGEVKILRAYIPKNEIAEGIYNLFVKVDYLTGSTTSVSSIEFKLSGMDLVTSEVVGTSSIPWWVFFIVLFLVILILYKLVKK